MSENIKSGAGGALVKGIGPIILFMVVLGIAGMIIYKTFSGVGSEHPSSRLLHNSAQSARSFKDKKKKSLTFVPADFDLNMDEDQIITILKNPEKHSREFGKLVYNINIKVLNHVANRMDLPKDLKKEVETEYKHHHEYMKKMYLRDFESLKDTTSNLYRIWYKNQASSSVKLFNEVASKYTCYLVDLIFSTVAQKGGYDFLKKNKNMETPCGIALEEAMYPMLDRLEKRAQIDDFSESKGLLEEKVETTIAELAVMEVRDKKALEKRLTSKFLGFDVSSTDVEVSAISVLKVGYKLDRQFSVALKPRKKEVIVTLPQPEILSHEVYPRVDKLDIGWMKNLNKEDFNDYFNSLREAFREDAYNSHIFEKSKKQVENLLNMMLEPVVKGMGSDYKIIYRYHKIYDDDLQKMKKKRKKTKKMS
ncbi:MAG TPA: DUF4230 domain-containing protein [Saprospiraceae bacterium]|nr:DUF4230 domain-containing protein [Saprospiraceae bacterium]